eukprot:7651736-Alexandrium_andersonii.AAC.1
MAAGAEPGCDDHDGCNGGAKPAIGLKPTALRRARCGPQLWHCPIVSFSAFPPPDVGPNPAPSPSTASASTAPACSKYVPGFNSESPRR